MNGLKKPVVVREVWADNLVAELFIIQRLVPDFPCVSMDTEFPGVILSPNVEKHEIPHLSPEFKYRVMKANVDALKLIQLGLAFSDPHGNLPDLGTDHCYVWQFNFRDFDPSSDPHNPSSVALLEKQGIDFKKNREFGINSETFGVLLQGAGFPFNSMSLVNWVTFHGAYDFGFLIKTLTRRDLPDDLGEFMATMNVFFGGAVYDVKHMMKYCRGLYGGLERVANTLGVDRAVGKSHQAGSDSLLTMDTFMRVKELYFNGGEREEIVKFQSVLFGLEVKGGGQLSVFNFQYSCPYFVYAC